MVCFCLWEVHGKNFEKFQTYSGAAFISLKEEVLEEYRLQCNSGCRDRVILGLVNGNLTLKEISWEVNNMLPLGSDQSVVCVALFKSNNCTFLVALKRECCWISITVWPWLREIINFHSLYVQHPHIKPTVLS